MVAKVMKLTCNKAFDPFAWNCLEALHFLQRRCTHGSMLGDCLRDWMIRATAEACGDQLGFSSVSFDKRYVVGLYRLAMGDCAPVLSRAMKLSLAPISK